MRRDGMGTCFMHSVAWRWESTGTGMEFLGVELSSHGRRIQPIDLLCNLSNNCDVHRFPPILRQHHHLP